MGAGGSKSSEAAGSNAGPSGSSASASACPVPEEIRSKAVYNVYNQRMDPSACPKMVRTCAWVKIVLGLETTILRIWSLHPVRTIPHALSVDLRLF